VLNLADYGRVRIMADKLGIETIDREGRIVVLKFRPQAKVDPVRLVALVRQRPDLALVPPAALKLNLDGAHGAASGARGADRSTPKPEPRAPSPGKGSSRYANAVPSWWTVRARAGEVAPGFTKDEILKPAKEDPRAPGGVLERLGSLLRELATRV
jgi:hypothetical protein